MTTMATIPSGQPGEVPGTNRTHRQNQYSSERNKRYQPTTTWPYVSVLSVDRPEMALLNPLMREMNPSPLRSISNRVHVRPSQPSCRSIQGDTRR
jgi:hypothetical protein